jgi:hypothetical protein
MARRCWSIRDIDAYEVDLKIERRFEAAIQTAKCKIFAKNMRANLVHFVVACKREKFPPSSMFIFTKLLYMVNIVAQFLVMNQFLGQNNHAWGANILRDIIEGRDWERESFILQATL